MISKSIFCDIYIYFIGFYHIYISPYLVKINILKNYKKYEISYRHYIIIILLCLVKSIINNNDTMKMFSQFISDSVYSIVNMFTKFFPYKLFHNIQYLDDEHDYYVEYSHNNRIIKGVYTHNKLCDIIRNINDSYKYLNSDVLCTRALMGVYIINGDHDPISIKSILNEYIFNSSIKDILKLESVYYDEKSVLRIASIESLKKKEYKVNLISVHNKNKMEIYNIE